MKKILSFMMMGMTVGVSGFAAEPVQTLTFIDIWKLIDQHSSSMSAAKEDLQAAQIGETRAARHWFPRIYLNGGAYQTNDPAMSFMSVLDQRAIGSANFAPDALNHPQASWLEQGTLGVDMPLFEGGAKEAMAGAAQKVREAKELGVKAERSVQYAQSVESYAELLSLAEEQNQLSRLREDAQKSLSGYAIGSKSNPVGYSGLLGLKNLLNRLDGLLSENAAQQEGLKSQIAVWAGDLPAGWMPRTQEVEAFLDQSFTGLSGDQVPTAPAFVQAAQTGAEALEKAQGAETARLLPRVGIFGEGHLYNGDQDSAASYTAGAYLQWDLISMPNLGADDQAGAQTRAAQERARGLALQAQSDREKANQNLQALHRDISLLDDSAQLLEEQASVARNLFKNGSINALQWVEVLSRRADLWVERQKAQSQLAQMKTMLAVNSGYGEEIHDIP